MSNPTKPPLSQSGIRWLWIAALAITADQLSKLWIQHNMELAQTIKLLPVLNIFRTYNLGAAWSMCEDCGGWQRWAFSALAAGVSLVLLVWLRRLVLSAHRLLALGLTLIVGGALGNLIDRLYLGHVVDFVQVHWGNSYFPSFNVADSCISVGAALVILDSLRESQRERLAAQAGKPPGQGA
jgi:signal peptidase II